MSDARLRDLERRWRDTGTVEDEAAYLAERARAGQLPEDRLRLAAHLGHEAARLVTAAPSPPGDLAGWLRVMNAFGRVARARTALAVARLGEGAPTSVVAAALRALEEWALCPCDRHAKAIEERLDALPHEQIERRRRSASAARATLIAAQLAFGMDVQALDAPAMTRDGEGDLVDALIECVASVDPAVVRAAVSAELAPWALGASR